MCVCVCVCEIYELFWFGLIVFYWFSSIFIICYYIFSLTSTYNVSYVVLLHQNQVYLWVKGCVWCWTCVMWLWLFRTHAARAVGVQVISSSTGHRVSLAGVGAHRVEAHVTRRTRSRHAQTLVYICHTQEERYGLWSEAACPFKPDIWAKWILNAASKRQNIAE